ncbi:MULTISPECIES: preprotein translocase subunit YajC [unclassified Sphingomonas]|uniref:preprotein translocase subunit YajC n=1 Tax=unclassified Sphingomonas TaxID=196159 RepID=UPI001F586904|nr:MULTISPECIES: preprotein translocase subunit YajC [unclassified Sphingomonas]
MFATPAFAQTTGAATGPDGFLSLLVNFGPLLLVFVAFYFMILRPQQLRARNQASAINAVKKGDSVVTAGGIVGKVTKVEDRFVEVEIAPTTRVRVVKATLAEVTPLGSKPAND